MIILGLTGGIASGKGLVARIFQERGAHLIDADRIVHELLATGEESWREVTEHFGDRIQRADGSIDRRTLGEIVFNDTAKREWLNSLLHPRVFQAFHAQVKRIASRKPDALIVFEAALLIETGFLRNMDRTVVVYASPEQQLARLMERDRFTREHAEARIRSQMPLDEKRKHADFVIDNSGSREETERQALTVFEQVKQELEKDR